MHPAVLCMIASLGHSVPPQNITCNIEAKSRHYLDRMGIYRFLGVESGVSVAEHEAAGRFIPLTQIKTSDDLTNFFTELVPLLHLDPEHARPIQYTISELVRNVLEHAHSAEGTFVCAQYFKKSNTVRLGIVDRGIGLKKSLEDFYSPSDDLDAIRLALTPGITGTTTKIGGTEQNAGAGLFFIKTIAYMNRDPFLIYSGSAMFKLLQRTAARIVLRGDPFMDRHSVESNLPYWQGVVVGIDIALETVQEFTELLKSIRKFYFQAVKETHKEKPIMKKPKFV